MLLTYSNKHINHDIKYEKDLFICNLKDLFCLKDLIPKISFEICYKQFGGPFVCVTGVF